MFVGFILVLAGAFFLLRNFGFIPRWYGWSELWPLILIAFGLAMVGDSMRKRAKRGK
jgi:uncharacterized integral membrane protein